MTQKEELKKDLIAREIESLACAVSTDYYQVLEHLNNVTGPCCASAEDKGTAGAVIRAFLHKVRDSAVMLDRINREL